MEVAKELARALYTLMLGLFLVVTLIYVFIMVVAFSVTMVVMVKELF